MATLHYGLNASIRLDLADGLVPDQCGAPNGQPLADPAAAVAAALDDPLDYPPLGQSTTPGDRVVLALDHGVPQAEQITAAVVAALVRAGVAPDGITVLRTQADVDAGAENPCRLIAGEVGRRITLLTHDPADRSALAYLAADESGEPILLNRALHEADVVLPIGCLRRDAAAGYFGIHTTIFPTFSDQKAQLRFRSLRSLNGRNQRRLLTGQADHVAWLLGIQFTIQVVPASGDGVLHVLAGQSDAVRRRGRRLYRAAWIAPVRRRASLVVAAIEGGPGQQTWQNLGRALAAAEKLVEEGGAIAVCCELSGQLGPALQRMAHARSREAALRKIGKDRPADALPAAQLAHALDTDRVYLLSRLDPTVVESLDIAPIADPDELARLARRHRSCILLCNAPHAMVRVEEQ